MALQAQDGALLDAVRTVSWPARRRATSGSHGAHSSRMRGLSEEFTEYRAYRQGEDTRRIDWKLLGRTDRAYIRMSSERTLLSTMVVLDASASLAYPAQTLEKWTHARHIALGLAAAAHRGGDPVGLVVVGRNATRGLPPRTRRGVVQEIASILSEVRPGGTAELAPVLASLANVARIAIVADFLAEESELTGMAGSLSAAGKEVYAVHIVHEDEARPPEGSALFVDPEQPDLRRPMTQTTRGAYLANFEAWCEHLARGWLTAGAYYTRVLTNEPAAHAVRRITRVQAVLGRT